MIKVLASGSGGNCAVVSGKIMLDCGIKLNPEARHKHDIRLSDISAVLLSHEHGDHAGGVKDLIRYGVDVYASKGTLGALGLTRAIEVKHVRQVACAGWSIIPFATFHDAAEPLGFLLSDGDAKILYATDTGRLPYNFPELTHVMLEVNHDTELLAANMEPVVARRVSANHLSLDAALEFLQRQDKSALQEIWLLHMSDGNSDAARFKTEVQKITGVPVYVAG